MVDTKQVSLSQDDPEVWKLVVSIILDSLGYVSYFLLGIGDIIDFAWSPVFAFLLYVLYKNPTSAAIGFIEEVMPWSDFIPTATLTWIYFKYVKDKVDYSGFIDFLNFTKKNTKKN